MNTAEFLQISSYVVPDREALVSGDHVALALAAHTLKGSVVVFSAQAAGEAAQRLETISRQGDLAQAQEAYTALEKEIKSLKAKLEALKTESLVS